MSRRTIASLGLAAVLTFTAPGCVAWYGNTGWAGYPYDPYYGSIVVEPVFPIVVGPFFHRHHVDRHHHRHHQERFVRPRAGRFGGAARFHRDGGHRVERPSERRSR